jgi:sugar phosphate isomerase/epimerase
MKDACSAALELDAPVLRIDPWVAEGRLTPGELARVASESIERALDGTEEVLLGVENHGALANRKEFLDDLLGRIDSPRFGLTLDVGNLYWSGRPLDEVYEAVGRLAPRTVHTHVKNISYPPERRDERREAGWEYDRYACPLADGDIEYRRVVQALEAAGYEGALAVEDESAGRFSPREFQEVLRRDVEYMLTILR